MQQKKLTCLNCRFLIDMREKPGFRIPDWVCKLNIAKSHPKSDIRWSEIVNPYKTTCKFHKCREKSPD